MRVSGLVALLLAGATAACATRARPCGGPTCGTGRECVANVCAPAGADPVPPGAQRIVPELKAFAVVGSESERTSATATLGAEPRTASALYLAFDHAWEGQGDVLRAYLLLYPAPGNAGSTEDVPLEVWTTSGSFRRTHGPLSYSWLARPRTRGLARGSAPIRIDVTDIVRALGTRSDAAMAVVASSDRGAGVTVSTYGQGGSPRLEVYVGKAP